MEIEYGYCKCGCGNKTSIIKRNDATHGRKKGQHSNFVIGHRPKREYIGRSIEERFWEKVDKTSDCWLWLGGKNGKGYGSFTEDRAHRMSWRLAYGDIPNRLHVLHKCDNPSCVNPSHLFLGTNRDNAQDRKNKGRGGGLKIRGENNTEAKLSERDILEIRDLFKAMSLFELTDIYRISRTQIYRIIRHESWKHVN